MFSLSSTSRDVDPLHPAGGLEPPPKFVTDFHPLTDPKTPPLFYHEGMMETRLVANEGPMRLLIVDAADHSRDNLAAFLQLQDGLEVIGAAATAEQAIRFATLLQPEVVMMDINLPDADGFEVTRRMLAVDVPPTVILLTVHRRAQDQVRAHDAGAADLIEKSAGVDAILDVLQPFLVPDTGE